jgi:hypothetical protein
MVANLVEHAGQLLRRDAVLEFDLVEDSRIGLGQVIAVLLQEPSPGGLGDLRGRRAQRDGVVVVGVDVERCAWGWPAPR